MSRPMFGDVLALIGVVAIMGAAVAVVVHRWPEIGHWPESLPDLSAWNTCWKFTPQPDITAQEIATILAHTSGGPTGLGKVGVKQDDPNFALVKRNFSKIACLGGK